MKVTIEINMKNSKNISEAIYAVAEIYEMSESKEEQSLIDGGGSLRYKMEIEE